MAASFDEFYREHRADAVRWASALVGRTDVGEELAQDALLRTGQRLATLDEPVAYLRRTVVNASRSWFRAASREQRRVEIVSRGRRTAGEGRLPDASAEVLDILSRLPYRQRAAVVLRYWADWPDADIAAALGCRDATVRQLVRRGLTDLRAQLHERGTDR